MRDFTELPVSDLANSKNASHILNMSRICTDYLTPTGSTMVGAASAFAIARGFFGFNFSESSEEADSVAIHQDFAMVGQDIQQSKETLPVEAQG